MHALFIVISVINEKSSIFRIYIFFLKTQTRIKLEKYLSKSIKLIHLLKT